MIILGIGSNLNSNFGNRFSNIDLAISYLNVYGIKTLKMSSYYESVSYPNKNDPKFINVIISVETSLPPIDLMSVLIFVEEKLERKRIKKNEPRTCDIDIIDYKQQILNFTYKGEDLVIPHEKLQLRNFVLYPLREIFPDWKHPKTNEKISTIIEKLSSEDRKSIYKVDNN
jgi:2-amino-4-hydroxy-6-hydroxymethyldihydropteridine diphosphokinase